MSVTMDKELENEAEKDAESTEVVETEAADAEVEASAEESETSEDGDATAEAENEKTSPSWVRYAVMGASAAVFLAALGLSGFFGWGLWQDHLVNKAGQDAKSAAVSYAQVLTSIDSAKVDENFSQVLDGATGEFKDMYSQSSVQLRQLLIDNKAAAHGVVVDSAIQSQSKDKVVVLLFIDQSVSNTQRPDPRIDRSRVKMTMEKVDGRWRASKVELP